ncbi:hypothetical protein Tco_1131074 [Tanacetum coccineum]
METPSPIKRRGRPKKSGRDNENKNAVKLLSYHHPSKDAGVQGKSHIMETLKITSLWGNFFPLWSLTISATLLFHFGPVTDQSGTKVSPQGGRLQFRKSSDHRDDEDNEDNDIDEDTEHIDSAFDDIQEQNDYDSESMKLHPILKGVVVQRKVVRIMRIRTLKLLSLQKSIKRRGRPRKESYHGNVKAANSIPSTSTSLPSPTSIDEEKRQMVGSKRKAREYKTDDDDDNDGN